MTQAGKTFKVGEVWQTPRGMLWKVIGETRERNGTHEALLRLGMNGKGRQIRRLIDATGGWILTAVDSATPQEKP